MLAEEICAREGQVGVVHGFSVKKEEILGWSHLTLPPTLDLSSQVVLGIGCALIVVGSGGFLITLALLKPTVVYPGPPALLPSLLSMVLSQAMIALRGLRRGKPPLLTTSEEGLVLGSQNSLVGEGGFYLASPKDLSPLTGHPFSFSQIQF